MKLLVCEKCGASDFVEQSGFRICRYCETRYALNTEDIPLKNTKITLDDDIKSLLEKCRTDPANARRYASLVLDLDPTNNEAKKFF